VIADNCAIYANTIFNNSDDYGGSTLLLGALFFAFQIYGDFSGYSDIAVGTSRLFGFDLMKFCFSILLKKYRRVLASMAHIPFHLVQGLFVHIVGWK